MDQEGADMSVLPVDRGVVVVALLLTGLMVASPKAQAQVTDDLRVTFVSVQPSKAEALRPLAQLDYGAVIRDLRPEAQAARTVAAQKRDRSVGRKIVGGAIGGVGGFFGGGYLGAAIDGDCGGCDDPGFVGAIVGASVGAVVGTVLGVMFL
jgi:hypothetical protein